MHLQGVGVPVNVTLALQHLSMAAEAGVVEAHSPIGAAHLEGLGGVPVNHTLARQHFQMGADGGDGRTTSLCLCAALADASPCLCS